MSPTENSEDCVCHQWHTLSFTFIVYTLNKRNDMLNSNRLNASPPYLTPQDYPIVVATHLVYMSPLDTMTVPNRACGYSCRNSFSSSSSVALTFSPASRRIAGYTAPRDPLIANLGKAFSIDKKLNRSDCCTRHDNGHLFMSAVPLVWDVTHCIRYPSDAIM